MNTRRKSLASHSAAKSSNINKVYGKKSAASVNALSDQDQTSITTNHANTCNVLRGSEGIESTNNSDSVLAAETPEGVVTRPSCLLLNDSVVAAAMASGVVSIMETPSSINSPQRETLHRRTSICRSSDNDTFKRRQSTEPTSKRKNIYFSATSKKSSESNIDTVLPAEHLPAGTEGINQGSLFTKVKKQISPMKMSHNTLYKSPIKIVNNPATSETPSKCKGKNTANMAASLTNYSIQLARSTKYRLTEAKNVKQSNIISCRSKNLIEENKDETASLPSSTSEDFSDTELLDDNLHFRNIHSTSFLEDYNDEGDAVNNNLDRKAKASALMCKDESTPDCNGLTSKKRKSFIGTNEINDVNICSKNTIRKTSSRALLSVTPHRASPRNIAISSPNYLRLYGNCANVKISAFHQQKGSDDCTVGYNKNNGILLTSNTNNGYKSHIQLETESASAALYSCNKPLDTDTQKYINTSVSNIITKLSSQNTSDGSSLLFSPKPLSDATEPPLNLTALLGSPTCRLDMSLANGSSSGEDQLPDTQPPHVLVLAGVTAFVDVRSSDGSNRSGVVRDRLMSLGATVTTKLTSQVTHVIFKDGLKSTFQQSRRRNLFMVSCAWVEKCLRDGRRLPEADYPSVSLDKYSDPLFLSRLRKGKSMQPKEFAEEELAAEARMRRRRRLAASKTGGDSNNSNSEVSTEVLSSGAASPAYRPSMPGSPAHRSSLPGSPVPVSGSPQAKEWSVSSPGPTEGCNIAPTEPCGGAPDELYDRNPNSPLYGIAHLLTPGRCPSPAGGVTPPRQLSSPHPLTPARPPGRSSPFRHYFSTLDPSHLSRDPALLARDPALLPIAFHKDASSGDELRSHLKNKFLAHVQGALLSQAPPSPAAAQERSTYQHLARHGGGGLEEQRDVQHLARHEGGGLEEQRDVQHLARHGGGGSEEQRDVNTSTGSSTTSSSLLTGRRGRTLRSEDKTCSSDGTPTSAPSDRAEQRPPTPANDCVVVTPRRLTRMLCMVSPRHVESGASSTSTHGATVAVDGTTVTSSAIPRDGGATCQSGVTPVRRKQSFCSDDDDYNTPLAAKMYNRFLTRKRPEKDSASAVLPSCTRAPQVGPDGVDNTRHPPGTPGTGPLHSGSHLGASEHTLFREKYPSSRSRLSTAYSDRDGGAADGIEGEHRAVLESTRNNNCDGDAFLEYLGRETHSDLSSIKGFPVQGGPRRGCVRQSRRVSSMFGDNSVGRDRCDGGDVFLSDGEGDCRPLATPGLMGDCDIVDVPANDVTNVDALLHSSLSCQSISQTRDSFQVKLDLMLGKPLELLPPTGAAPEGGGILPSNQGRGGKRRRLLQNAADFDAAVNGELIIPHTPPLTSPAPPSCSVYDTLEAIKRSKTQRSVIKKRHMMREEPMPLPRPVHGLKRRSGEESRVAVVKSSDIEDATAVVPGPCGAGLSRATSVAVVEPSCAAGSADDSYEAFEYKPKQAKPAKPTPVKCHLLRKTKCERRTTERRRAVSSKSTRSRSRSGGSAASASKFYRSRSRSLGSGGQPPSSGSSSKGSGVTRRRRGRGSRSVLLDASLPSICLTSLHSSEVEVLYPIITGLGGFNITRRVAHHTTHLVTADGGGGPVRRTVNLLLGVLRGVRVVTAQWVYRSLQAEEWLPDGEYHITEGCAAAEVVADIKRQGRPLELLREVGEVFIHPHTAPPRADMLELLELAGGRVAASLSAARVVVWPRSKPLPTELLDRVTVGQDWCTRPLLDDRVLQRIIASSRLSGEDSDGCALDDTVRLPRCGDSQGSGATPTPVIRSCSSMSVDYPPSVSRERSVAGSRGAGATGRGGENSVGGRQLRLSSVREGDEGDGAGDESGCDGDVVVVHEKWLLDTVQCYAIQPYAPYVMHGKAEAPFFDVREKQRRSDGGGDTPRAAATFRRRSCRINVGLKRSV